MILKFNKWLIKETLGISNEVENFSSRIKFYVEIDFTNNDFTNKKYDLKLLPNFNLDEIIFDINILEIHYINNPIVASIYRNNKTLIVEINPKNLSITELEENLNHEINHIYNDIKGLKTKDEYRIAIKFKNIISQNPSYPYSVQLMTFIYLSQPTEIYATTSELFYSIKNANIITKYDFNKYLVNNLVWKNANHLLNSDTRILWNHIISENTDNYIIEFFNIKDINKWLINKQIRFHNAGKEYKKRLARLSNLLNINH